VDEAFITMIYQLIKIHGSPILLTLAGPTGAGKTEITERIRDFLQEKGMQITTVEMDNFYKDREFRDGKTHGKDVIHFDLFMQAMQDLLAGKSTLIPRYDFYLASSSHDLHGDLRPGQSSLTIQPADVIFLEGNFPFYIPELDDMIGLRTVYLTDDPIRLKRKWRRDIDLRKKYDPVGFVNRYFKTQFIRAQEIYLPLMEVCDLVVDTTAAKIWLKPAWQEKLITEVEI
jgi:uridine kinase